MVESTTERQGRGNTRENRAENRELGGGRRKERAGTQAGQLQEQGSRECQRQEEEALKSALVNLQYFPNPWERERKPNQPGRWEATSREKYERLPRNTVRMVPLYSGPDREGRMVRMVRGRGFGPGSNRRAALEAVGLGWRCKPSFRH